MDEMTEFVDDDVFYTRLGRFDEFGIEDDVSFGGTASPSGFHILDKENFWLYIVFFKSLN